MGARFTISIARRAVSRVKTHVINIGSSLSGMIREDCFESVPNLMWLELERESGCRGTPRRLHSEVVGFSISRHFEPRKPINFRERLGAFFCFRDQTKFKNRYATRHEAMRHRSVVWFLPGFLSTTTTTTIANATTSNNHTNNMNASELNPSENRRLQAVGGGASIHTLEAVAASDDAFPPLKLAVVKALSIIEIIKVLIFALINLPDLSDDQIRNSTPTREPGSLVRILLSGRLRRSFIIPLNFARIRFLLLCSLGLRI